MAARSTWCRLPIRAPIGCFFVAMTTPGICESTEGLLPRAKQPYGYEEECHGHGDDFGKGMLGHMTTIQTLNQP